MRKLLSAIVLIIIILIIIGAVVYHYRGPMTSSALSQKLGIKVTLKQINFNPPHILVDGFAMANPRGFVNPHALEIQKADIEAPYSNYKNTVVEIDKIELDDIQLNVELPAGRSNNWDVLMGQMAKEEKEDGSYAIIKLLVLNNLHVTITMPNGSVKTATLDHLEYRDIKTNSGDLGKKIMQAVIAKMMFDIKNIYQLPLKITQEGLDALNPMKDASSLDKLNPLNMGK